MGWVFNYSSTICQIGYLIHQIAFEPCEKSVCHWFNGHEFEQTPGYSKGGKPGVLQSMGSQRVGHDWATEQTQALHRCHAAFIIVSIQ